MKSNIINDKSFAFAFSIVKLTAIGALVRESVNAESKADFVHKLDIAQKECDETIYWLELIYAAKYISLEEFQPLDAEAAELLKIIRSIILSTKANALKTNS